MRLLLERGAVISRTAGLIERNIREIDRRRKKYTDPHEGWTGKGGLNLIKLFWKRIFEGDGLKRFWRASLGLNGNCHITLVGYHAKVLTNS